VGLPGARRVPVGHQRHERRPLRRRIRGEARICSDEETEQRFSKKMGFVLLFHAENGVMIFWWGRFSSLGRSIKNHFPYFWCLMSSKIGEFFGKIFFLHSFFNQEGFHD